MLIKKSNIVRSWIFICVLLSVMGPLYGQESQKTEKADKKNTITLALGYTHIPKGASLHDTEEKGYLVPSIGLDYMRELAPRLELVIMTDLELDHYLIFDKELERENAFLILGGIGYNFFNHFNAIVGAGAEFDKHENLFVGRVGLEYSFQPGKRWLIAPAFLYDIKKGYDTYALNVAFGYKF